MKSPARDGDSEPDGRGRAARPTRQLDVAPRSQPRTVRPRSDSPHRRTLTAARHGRSARPWPSQSAGDRGRPAPARGTAPGRPRARRPGRAVAVLVPARRPGRAVVRPHPGPLRLAQHGLRRGRGLRGPAARQRAAARGRPLRRRPAARPAGPPDRGVLPRRASPRSPTRRRPRPGSRRSPPPARWSRCCSPASALAGRARCSRRAAPPARARRCSPLTTAASPSSTCCPGCRSTAAACCAPCSGGSPATPDAATVVSAQAGRVRRRSASSRSPSWSSLPALGVGAEHAAACCHQRFVAAFLYAGATAALRAARVEGRARRLCRRARSPGPRCSSPRRPAAGRGAAPAPGRGPAGDGRRRRRRPAGRPS